jgi:ribonuclease P protein component
LKRNESFPLCYRVTLKRDIQRLKDSQKRIKCNFVIIVFEENEVGHPRLLVVVSSKIGNAVMRNRIKRLIREVFRRNLKSIGGYDLMVVAKKTILNADYSSLENDIRSGVNLIN